VKLRRASARLNMFGASQGGVYSQSHLRELR
jgi:hypothetical protein